MGRFLAANLGERSDLPAVTRAVQLAQKPYFKASAKMTQGLAWQRVNIEGEFVIDKNGGLSGTSTYIGMLPERHIGIVVPANRGKCHATTVGRKLLLALAGQQRRPGASRAAGASAGHRGTGESRSCPTTSTSPGRYCHLQCAGTPKPSS